MGFVAIGVYEPVGQGTLCFSMGGAAAEFAFAGRLKTVFAGFFYC